MLSRSRKAFTLLELIVVIVVLGILAALAIPTFRTVIDNSRTKTAVASAESIGRNAVALASFEQGRADAGTVASEAPAKLVEAAGEAGVGAADVSVADKTVTVNGYVVELSFVGTGAKAVSVDGEAL